MTQHKPDSASADWCEGDRGHNAHTRGLVLIHKAVWGLHVPWLNTHMGTSSSPMKHHNDEHEFCTGQLTMHNNSLPQGPVICQGESNNGYTAKGRSQSENFSSRLPTQ